MDRINNINIKSNFIYSSMKRDIKQSNLVFWNNILKSSEIDRDIFKRVSEIAEEEKEMGIVDMIKKFIGDNNGNK